MRESLVSRRVVIVGVLVFLGGLLAFLPASLLRVVWPREFPVALLATGGTVWKGGLYWQQGHALGELRWQLAPWPLALGRVRAQLSGQGAVKLDGELQWQRGAWAVRGLKGALPSSLVTPLLPGWELGGTVQAEGLNLARAGLRKGAWSAGQGGLYWAGGDMHYQLGGQSGRAHLPAVRVQLHLQGTALALDLVQANDGAALANLHLLADGSTEVQVRQRLLSYSPDYHGVAQPPDMIVVNVRQAPAGG